MTGDAVFPGRFTAEPDPDQHDGPVRFHIGMSINRLRVPRTRPAWRAFNRAARHSDVAGVFHETCTIGARTSEAVSVDVPVMGRVRATGHVPIAVREQSAGHRMNDSAPDTPAVTPDLISEELEQL